MTPTLTNQIVQSIDHSLLFRYLVKRMLLKRTFGGSIAPQVRVAERGGRHGAWEGEVTGGVVLLSGEELSRHRGEDGSGGREKERERCRMVRASLDQAVSSGLV